MSSGTSAWLPVLPIYKKSILYHSILSQRVTEKKHSFTSTLELGPNERVPLHMPLTDTVWHFHTYSDGPLYLGPVRVGPDPPYRESFAHGAHT